MSCIFKTRIWLTTHFFITVIVHTVTLYIYISLLFLYVVIFLYSPCFRSFIRAINSNIRLHSYAHEGRYFYGIILLLKETLLVFVYVSFAFSYEWIRRGNNIDGVTSIHFYRWLIEASCAPFLLCAFLVGYSMQCLDMVFEEYQIFHLIGITLKISLFFWIRYAEIQPERYLYHMETSIVGLLCR